MVDLQLTGDDPVRLGATIDRAIAAGAELVLTSGGISMGAHEPVRQLLEPLGATVGTVDMQPGGPQAHARYRTVPVVCFPGNPVSSQLSFKKDLIYNGAKMPAHPVATVRFKNETGLTLERGPVTVLAASAID